MMARTQDRGSQGSGARVWNFAHSLGGMRRQSFLRLDRADGCFALFIAVQIVEFAILFVQGSLDLAIAVCLSTSLLTVATLFTSQRRGGDPAVASNQAPTAAHAWNATVQSPALCAPSGTLSEESQSWVDLMARINHELRTPLNAVIGFADLMERELFGPLGNARYRDYAAHIRQSGEALLKSAEDTLALSSLLASQPISQRPQVSNLATLARDAWSSLEPSAATRTVAIDIAIPDTLDVAGDRLIHRQIIINLLIEALARAQSGTKIKIQGRAHGDMVRFQVAVQADQAARVTAPSLALCVASTLLEHQGSSLVASDHQAARTWTASTVLDLAVQSDFFSAHMPI